MAGDQASLSARELVENHLDALYQYACRLTRSPVDAEDLVQDAFLIAAQKLHQLREPDRAFAWLVKILRGLWARELRRRPPTAEVGVDEICAAEPGRPGDLDDVDPERLAAVLDALPADFREPLLLFYFEELKYREIAEILDVPIGTVMSRIARAKAHLRERLAPVPIDEDSRP